MSEPTMAGWRPREWTRRLADSSVVTLCKRVGEVTGTRYHILRGTEEVMPPFDGFATRREALALVEELDERAKSRIAQEKTGTRDGHNRERLIGIDFDGTIAKHRYPYIGSPVPGAIETIRLLIDGGHKPILNTCRSGEDLQKAIEWLRHKGLEFHAYNENLPDDPFGRADAKVFAHMYIDDAALGCPLIFDEHGDMYVDWGAVARRLRGMGWLPPGKGPG